MDSAANNRIVMAIMTIMLVAIALSAVNANPQNPMVIYNSNSTREPYPQEILNTSGGSITTMVVNATQQNYRWKAYVGNITGKLTLDNALNYTIFEWDISTVTGEVYATRSPDSIDWANVNCSNQTQIAAEEAALNHIYNPNDNITKTFNKKLHDEFLVGTRKISANSCYSVHTYVNSTNQSTTFQEVLLYDSTNDVLVYSAAINRDKYGFDFNVYDFQMIVPEDAESTWESSTAYYFYVELV